MNCRDINYINMEDLNMARLRFTHEESNEYTSPEISLRRAQTYLHLLYVKEFKMNVERLKKYVGPPEGKGPPDFAGIPQFVKDKLPNLPEIPAGMEDPPDYGTKTANEARLKLAGPGNKDLVYAEILV